MQFPSISQKFNSIAPNLSSGLQTLGKALASFINEALVKRLGVKHPPLTPFAATLLVGGLSLATVGLLYCAVFGSSKKPAHPPKPDDKNQKTRRRVQSLKKVQKIRS